MLRIPRGMRAFRWPRLLLLLVILVGTDGNAAVPASKASGWEELRSHLTLQEAATILFQAVGHPLMVQRGRNGLFEQWIYDRGGWLFFQRGRLVDWKRPAMPVAQMQQ